MLTKRLLGPLAMLAVVAGAATACSGPPPPPPTFTVSEHIGAHGETVLVEGGNCRGTSAEVRFDGAWPVRLSVYGGRWEQGVEVPADAAVGEVGIQVRCLNGEQEVFRYPDQPFEVVAQRQFTVTPASGPVGTTITGTAVHPCSPIPADSEITHYRLGIFLRAGTESHPVAGTMEVPDDGYWEVTGPIPEGVAPGSYQLETWCAPFMGDSMYGPPVNTYASVPFTVTP